MDRARKPQPAPRYVPVESGFSEETAAILRLQRAIGNQRVQRLLLQRSNPSDPRLPANQAEALSRARDAKRAIDAAIAAMRTSAVPEQRNAAQFMAQRKWVPAALTPRHDSTVGAATIHFFPGQNNYTGSQTLDGQTTHKVSPKRTWVYVRARDHANVDNPLAQAEIQSRITAAVSEVAHTKAAHPGQPVTIDLYRARFNGLFEVPPFNALSTAPDLTLNSRGPRTPRARAIFDRILAEEATIRAAYDANTGGVRGAIDTYAGPEGMNRVNSSRLQRLREAFFAFRAPVTDFPRFRNAIRTAAAGLDAADRKAVDDSNEWQQLINAHVTDEAQRTEIRVVISGQTLAPPNRAAFLASWQMRVRIDTGGQFVDVTPGMQVRYRDGALQVALKAELPAGQTNTGLVLFIRAAVLRGSTPAAVSQVSAFPPRGQSQATRVSVAAPTPVPATGDNLTIRLEVLDADRTTVLDTKTINAVARAGNAFTKAQAIAAATADQTFFRDTGATGLIGLLTSRGGHPARVAEALRSGALRIEPVIARHDSPDFVRAAIGAANPEQTGFFHGVTYQDAAPDTANSLVESATIGGQNPAPGVLFVRRTFDVATGGRISDAELINVVIHEAVHALDAGFQRHNTSDLESYKTEFRAYWLDGSHGPPDQATCPTPPARCRPTAIDPSMSAPGPKSPRARAIFDHLYRTYPFVKPNYDNNVGGFREAVDNYLWPDGINLLVSVRLDNLQKLFVGFNGTNFAAFRTDVLRLAAALNADDRREVAGNVAWRDLVEEKVVNPADQQQIKRDLGIPL